MDKIEAATRGVLQKVASSANGVAYLSNKEAGTSVTAGLLEANPSLVDSAGNVATRLTPLGTAYLASPEGTDPNTLVVKTDAEAPVAAGAATALTFGKRVFQRVQVTLPKAAPGTRSSQYPTDELAAPTTDAGGQVFYDGFFLAPDEKHPDAAKSFAAVASAANKRWKTKTPARKFTSRVMDGAVFGQPGILGVGVFRTE